MKKYYLSFIVFMVVFATAMFFVYTKANPSNIRLPAESSVNTLSNGESGLEWHGRMENEYGTYTGTLMNDLFQGEGEFSFLTGETYVGDWEDSYMSGNGTMVFPEVGEYSGEMNSSQRNGSGSFAWKSGDTYEGSWINDEMSGSGKYTFSDGSTFKGTFSHNKPISGKYTYNAVSDNTGIESLIYEFSDTTERLILTTTNGMKYDGEPSGLSEKGAATVTYPSGNVYNGEMYAGKRDGSGKYYWYDSSGSISAYYEGEWLEDQMSGYGKYHYSRDEYPYLDGYFENGNPTGTLTYYKEAGNTFETVWNNGYCISVKET